MKRLLLMRHGDAVRGTPEMSDHERPLSTEGKAEVARAGAWLAAQGALPDFVLCSSARRTRETLEALGIPTLIPCTHFSDQLYLASPGEMLARLQDAPDTASTLLLIGHNPGIHEFCLQFAPHGHAEALDKIALGFKTGALATLTFDVAHWSELPRDGGTLVEYVTHKPAY